MRYTLPIALTRLLVQFYHVVFNLILGFSSMNTNDNTHIMLSSQGYHYFILIFFLPI